MSDYSHLNQFGSLVSDCQWWIENFSHVPATSSMYRLFMERLLASQRFICPEVGTQFVGDVAYQDKHLDLVHLPFDDVAILYLEHIAASERCDKPGAVPCVTVYSKSLLTEGGHSEQAFGALTATYAGGEFEAFLRYAAQRSFGTAVVVPPGANGWLIVKPYVTVIDPATFNSTGGLPLAAELRGGIEALRPPQSVFESNLEKSNSGAATRDATAIIDLCCALACSNVHSRSVGADDATAARRARAGKKPLFSYKVLEVDVGADESLTGKGGGSHASPRTHLRRGHIRRLASGRIVWVNAAVVRGQTPGIVVKDYRI